jgi:hypothetical protein
MAYFQTKNPYLGKFWRDLQWKMLVYFWPFSLFYRNLVYFVAILHSLWLVGIFFPALVCCTKNNLETLTWTALKLKYIGNFFYKELSPQTLTVFDLTNHNLYFSYSGKNDITIGIYT